MYPNRVQPNRQTFNNIFSRLGDTGQFKPKSDVGRPKILTVDREDDILVRVANNPELSNRRLSAMTGVSNSSVFRILKKENLRLYQFTPVQNVLPRDYPLRLNFAQGESHFQHEFNINVWCGIFKNMFLDPYELPANLNGNSYLEFLQTTLFDNLEELLHNRRRDMWFMQDGAPPHYPLIVRNYLDQQ
ncbi:hypothetical protein ILUMI_16852 [Ignelater luminosus]|uniref:Transposase n=1 Tax=Ignelater luminosus TaxID=2038154 RepID=A0A8K0G848_IGNLU|nr:hypothetical protein ILUMI_16852 [Ignelater luminosus]